MIPLPSPNRAVKNRRHPNHKTMDSDWLQFAAYAIILIVMGMATVIKKISEAQRRRKLLEENERRQLMTAREKRGLTAEDSESPETTEPEVEPSSSEIPEVDLEEVLRRALGFPASQTEKERYKRRLEKARPRQKRVITTPDLPTARVSKPPALVGEEPQVLPVVSEKEVGTGWSDFTRQLLAEQPDELSRAIVLSEIIAPPVSFRGRSGGIGRPACCRQAR